MRVRRERSPVKRTGLTARHLYSGATNDMTPPMNDRLFFASAAALTVLIVGFAVVWPQGEGLPSPGPFGGPVHISDAAKADLKKDAEKAAAAHASPQAKAAGLRTGASK